MIMGGGKTTVIARARALLLADGQSTCSSCSARELAAARDEPHA